MKDFVQQGAILKESLFHASQIADQEIDNLDDEQSYTVFRLNQTYFGLTTECVYEIIENPSIHSIPGNRHHAFLGIANYHGEICPCIDLERFLVKNLQLAKEPLPKPSSAIVFGKDDFLWFLLVDTIEAVVELKEKMEEAPTRAIREYRTWQGKRVSILDEESLAFGLLTLNPLQADE